MVALHEPMLQFESLLNLSECAVGETLSPIVKTLVRVECCSVGRTQISNAGWPMSVSALFA